jgi:hypothetical protein
MKTEKNTEKTYKNLLDVMQVFPSEKECVEHLENLRLLENLKGILLHAQRTTTDLFKWKEFSRRKFIAISAAQGFVLEVPCQNLID